MEGLLDAPRGRTEGDRTTEIVFSPSGNDDGIEVLDPIDRHQYTLRTAGPVEPDAADTGRFSVPVDAAIALTTESITLPTVVPVFVRDTAGRLLAEAEHFAHEALPPGAYSIELSAPIKLYLRTESAVTVTSNATRTRVAFDGATEVAVGARSRREHPAATVTTTDDPADVMRAVSTFGSALATTSPERSYPTFRGHPPLIERGDELSVPGGVAPPETGLRLELPAELRSVYVAAPLAYYLGATVVPGDVPRLVADTGFEHPLRTERGFEREVERVLKQVFFLDCVTRTEGMYPVDLHERRAIEPRVDLDFAELYRLPIAERIERYLGVPFSTLDGSLPEWKLTTHVEPTPDGAELLPFVVDDLAVVRTPTSRTPSAERGVARAPLDEEQAGAVEEFLRNEGAFTRGAAVDGIDRAYVQPEASDSLEAAWIGDGTPLGASKATLEAYRNQLDRTPTDGNIDITVVLNEFEEYDAGGSSMAEERELIDEVYGSRLQLPFDVTVREGVTVAELRSILRSSTEFLHYIGHVDEEGFECADGKLDAATVSTVGVDAFFLNACRSYRQGMALIEAGGIGGIVTLEDVVNSGAIAMGRAIARLLNGGFPLGAALEIARDETVSGSNYVVVGDGGLAIAQAESGTPILCAVESAGDSYELELQAFPTRQLGMGSIFIPYTEGNDEHFLSSGTIGTFELSEGELRQFLSLENLPMRVGGELYWSRDTDISEL